MRLREIFKLSHRELTAYHTRSIATIITVGVLFGLILALSFLIQGAENLVLRYARVATGGPVFFASYYDGPNGPKIILERVNHYGGELVELSADQLTELPSDLPSNAFIVKFDQPKIAYQYYSEDNSNLFHYNKKLLYNIELFSNQMNVYKFFHSINQNLVRPATIILIIVAVVILAFTMAHILSQNAQTFVLYRSLGASKHQILLIYLAYLTELCIYALLFAVVVALIIAIIITLISWQYLTTNLTEVYPHATTFAPILIGVNWQVLATIALMFTTVPLTFVLCLDQFSDKKLITRLKGA